MSERITEARFEVSPKNFILVKLHPDIVQAGRFYIEISTDGAMMIEPISKDRISVRALP